MAVRQKKRAVPAYKRGREFKVILPPEMSEWIERQARDEGKPQSRIIIDHLSRIPYLEAQAKLDKLVNEMHSILARYGARVVLADLGEHVLPAVDYVLAAKSAGEVQPRLDKLRVLRAQMLNYTQNANESRSNQSDAPFRMAWTISEAENVALRQAGPMTKAKRAVRRSPIDAKAPKTGKK